MLAERFLAVVNDFPGVIISDRFTVDIFVSVNQPLVVNAFIQFARVAWYSFVFDVWFLLSCSPCLYLKTITNDYALLD